MRAVVSVTLRRIVHPHIGHSRSSAITHAQYRCSACLDKPREWLLWLASVTLKRETDCFADEVAIDFPSIAHLVARVRRSFLAETSGERGDTVKTEICLSTEEAHRGAVVPVTVLLRATCPDCGGRGETWAERCGACDGTGHALVPRRLRVTVPPRILDGSRFHFRLHTPHEASVHVEVRVAISEI
jgi:hypothetical protein